MVRWEVLNMPKKFRGLDFLDVRATNICLMCKWINKLERGDDSICCELLRRKCLNQKSIF
jgi:hypothetical protein